MVSSGFYVKPTYKTVINFTDSNENNDNNTVISFTLSYEKDDSFVFLPNQFLNFMNPDEEKFKYGYFAFMMVKIVEGSVKKNDAIICYSQNPFYSVFNHNNFPKRKRKVNNDKWKLSIILGPFLLKNNCINCCKDWLKKTRGINSKKNRAKKLKLNYGTDIYVSDKIVKEDLEILISNVLPNIFWNEYVKLMNK